MVGQSSMSKQPDRAEERVSGVDLPSQHVACKFDSLGRSPPVEEDLDPLRPSGVDPPHECKVIWYGCRKQCPGALLEVQIWRTDRSDRAKQRPDGQVSECEHENRRESNEQYQSRRLLGDDRTQDRSDSHEN